MIDALLKNLILCRCQYGRSILCTVHKTNKHHILMTMLSAHIHFGFRKKTGYNLSRASSRVMFSNLTIVRIIAWVSRRQGAEFNDFSSLTPRLHGHGTISCPNMGKRLSIVMPRLYTWTWDSLAHATRVWAQVASFPDSTPQPFIHGAIKSWGVESGNEARHKTNSSTVSCPDYVDVRPSTGITLSLTRSHSQITPHKEYSTGTRLSLSQSHTQTTPHKYYSMHSYPVVTSGNKTSSAYVNCWAPPDASCATFSRKCNNFSFCIMRQEYVLTVCKTTDMYYSKLSCTLASFPVLPTPAFVSQPWRKSAFFSMAARQ